MRQKTKTKIYAVIFSSAPFQFRNLNFWWSHLVQPQLELYQETKCKTALQWVKWKNKIWDYSVENKVNYPSLKKFAIALKKNQKGILYSPKYEPYPFSSLFLPVKSWLLLHLPLWCISNKQTNMVIACFTQLSPHNTLINTINVSCKPLYL